MGEKFEILLRSRWRGGSGTQRNRDEKRGFIYIDDDNRSSRTRNGEYLHVIRAQRLQGGDGCEWKKGHCTCQDKPRNYMVTTIKHFSHK